MLTASTLAEHKARFDRYSATFLREDSSLPLRLKYEHTYKVLEIAEAIVNEEPASAGLGGDCGQAALLGALYHDIGRFMQFMRWRTFQDKHSTNHGSLAVRILKQEGLLQDEPRDIRRMVLVAVGLHNGYQLPRHLPENLRRVTQVVRDADKVDIFRIMATHLSAEAPSQTVVLSVRNEPDKWSPEIVRTVLAEKVPSYNDLRYINDFRLLLASWLEELHYATARTLLARSGHVERVLAELPSGLAAVKEHLLKKLEQAKRGRT